eukprot:5311203-Prymnesium_polylepis.2
MASSCSAQAAFAWLLRVDLDLDIGHVVLDEGLQLGGPRLECASGLAGLDHHDGAGGGRGPSLLHTDGRN